MGESIFSQMIPKRKGGSKQLKIVKCLFEDNAMSLACKPTYLERSTRFIKDVLEGEHLPRRKQQFHRLLSVKLTATGPVYFANLGPSSVNGLRHAGYYFYDSSVATALFREAVLNHGRLRTMRNAFVRSSCEAGNLIWSLLSNKMEKWSAL